LLSGESGTNSAALVPGAKIDIYVNGTTGDIANVLYFKR
jgi:hypothetical protein